MDSRKFSVSLESLEKNEAAMAATRSSGVDPDKLIAALKEVQNASRHGSNVGTPVKVSKETAQEPAAGKVTLVWGEGSPDSYELKYHKEDKSDESLSMVTLASNAAVEGVEETSSAAPSIAGAVKNKMVQWLSAVRTSSLRKKAYKPKDEEAACLSESFNFDGSDVGEFNVAVTANEIQDLALGRELDELAVPEDLKLSESALTVAQAIGSSDTELKSNEKINKETKNKGRLTRLFNRAMSAFKSSKKIDKASSEPSVLEETPILGSSGKKTTFSVTVSTDLYVPASPEYLVHLSSFIASAVHTFIGNASMIEEDEASTDVEVQVVRGSFADLTNVAVQELENSFAVAADNVNAVIEKLEVAIAEADNDVNDVNDD